MTPLRRLCLVAASPFLAGAALGSAPPCSAQVPVSLADAIREAVANGPAAGLARTDSMLASAAMAGARSFANPTFVTTYTKDAPQYHAEFEQPLDILGSRGARARAAGLSAYAAYRRLALDYAVVTRDVTVAYAGALGAGRRHRLSVRAAADADELVRIAQARRDAGDASDLDVGLASLTAGDLHNRALADSVTALDATLRLQLLLGRPGTALVLTLSDSLETLEPDVRQGGRALTVAVADWESRASEATLAFERRDRIGTPSLTAGVETHEGDGSPSRALPILGLSIPLPFWNRNPGGVGAARAGVVRATIALEAARRESEAAIARAARDRDAAAARLAMDRQLLDQAERLAALATTAYREGAWPLSSVIEAQRGVRETLANTIDDAVALVTAKAEYALATAGEDTR